MRCSDFLELYSDYRDGLISDPRLGSSIERHITVCRRCMNYDALVSRGVMALKATSDIKPSRPFMRQLEHRLADPLPVDSVRTVPPRVMLGLMAAAVAALLVWLGAGAGTPGSTMLATTDSAPTAAVSTPTNQRVRLSDVGVPAFWGERPALDPRVSFVTWISRSR